MKIEMKIGRYVKYIGKDDLILDNGAVIQVPTQTGGWGVWDYNTLRMSKKLFKELKQLNFIYLDKNLTDVANKSYEKPWLFYYRFDIDEMIECGYKVVE